MIYIYCICLVGLNITFCIPVGQFGCSVVPPSDAKGMLAIESEYKNISAWYNFLSSGLNHTKLPQIVMIRMMCFESERKRKL